MSDYAAGDPEHVLPDTGWRATTVFARAFEIAITAAMLSIQIAEKQLGRVVTVKGMVEFDGKCRDKTRLLSGARVEGDSIAYPAIGFHSW